ncbi:response regulator, partial [Staphylococcus capitis]|uniref:response regulator n=1 Tax=Staphylococcus capitis TaxID=29388 RepID=UPI0021B2C18D
MGIRREDGDIILVDVGLGDIDGVCLIKGLRECVERGIMVISGGREEESIVKGLEYGGNDYMSKGFNIDELEGGIRVGVGVWKRRE